MVILVIGTPRGSSELYRMFVRSRGTTSTQAKLIADATTSATWTSEEWTSDNITYTTAELTAELADLELFEAAKIVSYARVWIIIAFVVILRRLIETRSRAPPTWRPLP